MATLSSRSINKKESGDRLIVRGARENNLKNVSVEIPRGKFVVITGPSGSGKSSLAFNVIYNEGQRRYLEGLSAFARNYLDIAGKPDADAIENLSPTIAIDQKSVAKNPRSTVGTLTEIYDYLRVLFAKAGEVRCPNCSAPLIKRTTREILDDILAEEDRSDIHIYARVRGSYGEVASRLQAFLKEGYATVRLDGMRTERLTDVLKNPTAFHYVDIMIDRFLLSRERPDKERILDSLEEAFKTGEEAVVSIDVKKDVTYQKEYACGSCHISLPDFGVRSFSFNNPEGACPGCSGLGERLTLQGDRVVTSEKLTLEEGAIRILGRFAGKTGRKSAFWESIEAFSRRNKIDLNKPFGKFSKKEREKLMRGDAGTSVECTEEYFPGLVPFLEEKYFSSSSDHLRKEMEECMEPEICSLCNGRRLRKESLSVFVENKTIAEWAALTLFELRDETNRFIASVPATGETGQMIRSILTEILVRLEVLIEIGLGYLAVDRTSVTLSGGEGQRIRLSMLLISKLSGVMYVLDEPSMGLHSRDTHKLIETLKQLKDSGNSMIVVEHDRDIMEAAEWIIDMGPGAGDEGGEVMFSGTYDELLASSTATAQHLSYRKKITRKIIPINSNKGEWITIHGAKEHNLKNITASFPLRALSCVTGVSGSGKSSLIRDIFSKAARRHFYNTKDIPGEHDRITGLDKLGKVITINQEPIGRTSRSNVATYSGIFSLVRDVFVETPLSESRRYDASRFSFNLKGGRCEQCQGEGTKKIEMYLMPDMFVPCDVCNGTRYNKETLEVEYHGVTIADVLNMSVSYAKEFFAKQRLIREKLEVLEQVGLGYLRLGQGAPDLSGGGAQRIKLATELARKSMGNTLYILDEPTIGLHFEDISRLLFVLSSLVERGNTVVVVEHNTEMIAAADWVVDLGPEGGDQGGELLFVGTPKELKKCKHSWTGKYL